MSSVSVRVMPWWKSGKSSSTRSSPSHLLPSPSASSSTSATPPISAWASRSARIFPWSRRGPQPRHSRQRKIRRLTSPEIDALALENPADGAAPGSTTISCTSRNLDSFPSRCASSPMLLPRPLPRPEDTVATVCRESVSSRALGLSPQHYHGVPLPSPLKASSRAEGNGTAAEPTPLESAVGSRIAYQTSCGIQQVDITSNKPTISHRRKVLLNSNYSETTNFRLNIPPKSAPVSEFSSPNGSPVDSPGRLSCVDFSVSPGFQTWSAPVIPSTGMITSSSSPDMTKHSPEPSSLASPKTKSPILRSRNSSAPPSPLHPKMFPESSAAWHDNGGNVTVHPLPLPPGALLPSQSTFGHQSGHQSAVKAEGSLKTNQWQKGKLIGSGTFGVVYEATNRNTGALCAMKEVFIIPDDPKSAECLNQLEQEMKFLSQLKHPNIVQYYGSETIEDRLYIYLEYVHPGSINRYVRQYCGALTESVVRNFTRHILNGLIYLHSKKVMHRDIKGANLLVDVNGVVKLADFGMAKHLSGAAPSHSVRGSPFWMAPEMLQATMNKDIGYDLAVDIWSLGCTIIEMFTGKHPWSDLEGPQAMFKVLHKDPPIPETLSNDGKDFLQRCFRRNPVERPTASMLLDHPFVRNTNNFNAHGSLQSFAGLKIQDNAMSLSDKGKGKSEPYVKRKPIPNGNENNQSHLEIAESSRLSFRSGHEAQAPSFSLASAQNAVQLGVGNPESRRLPNPTPRKT